MAILGTGKTTVANIISKLFANVNGTMTKLPIVFASRETLVGMYVGHTEANVMEAIKKAQGGILFIDEAYALTGDDYHDFGYRALDCIVNQMDIHRYDITFIFAGYKMEMLDFLKSNPGLKSRIPFKLEFTNYDENELFSIFSKFLKDKGYRMSSSVENLVIDYFKNIKNGKFFGNGRVARNLAERAEIIQANRLISQGITKGRSLNNINKEDVIEAIDSLEEPKEKIIGFTA